jgi:hypothetical protein
LNQRLTHAGRLLGRPAAWNAALFAAMFASVLAKRQVLAAPEDLGSWPSMRSPKSKTAAFRARHRDETRRWRQRVKNGVALYSIQIGADDFELLTRFGELPTNKIDNRAAVSAAIERLLRRAIVALLKQENTARR